MLHKYLGVEGEPMLGRITDFINGIGIICSEGIVDQHTFLPGVDIVDGDIVYDTLMLDNYGDLLHEAGHVAVLKSKDRYSVTSPDVWGDLGEEQAEMAAIAWSWAAAQHLHISPKVIFHDEGYRGGADAIIERFNNRNYIGVDILEWMGMTTENNDLEIVSQVVYPDMKYWLRPTL